MQVNKRKKTKDSSDGEEVVHNQDILLNVEFAYIDKETKEFHRHDGLSATAIGVYDEKRSSYAFNADALPLAKVRPISWHGRPIHACFYIAFHGGETRVMSIGILWCYITEKTMEGLKSVDKNEHVFKIEVNCLTQPLNYNIKNEVTWIRSDGRWLLSQMQFSVGKEAWNRVMTFHIEEYDRVYNTDKRVFLIK